MKAGANDGLAEPRRLDSCTKKKPDAWSGFLEKFGGNLLSRKLYNHYHRQGCV